MLASPNRVASGADLAYQFDRCRSLERLKSACLSSMSITRDASAIPSKTRPQTRVPSKLTGHECVPPRPTFLPERFVGRGGTRPYQITCRRAMRCVLGSGLPHQHALRDAQLHRAEQTRFYERRIFLPEPPACEGGAGPPAGRSTLPPLR